MHLFCFFRSLLFFLMEIYENFARTIDLVWERMERLVIGRRSYSNATLSSRLITLKQLVTTVLTCFWLLLRDLFVSGS